MNGIAHGPARGRARTELNWRPTDGASPGTGAGLARARRASTSVLGPKPGTQRGGGLERQAPIWRLVRLFVEEQISIAAYPVGSWLPSVRQLADDLGVNRNTVSKVYQALTREGLVESFHGSGVRVLRVPANAEGSDERFARSMQGLAREAMLFGVRREEFVGLAARIADEVYLSHRPRIAFIECNADDARFMANDLARHVGFEVEPLVLDSVSNRAKDFDILSTTFFHFRELADSADASHAEVVPIHHTPSHQSTLDIARLPRGTRVGVVCANQRTLERVTNLIRPYVRGALRGCTVEQPAELAQLDVDVVVDTTASHAVVTDRLPVTPTITVTFHLEPEGIKHLVERVQAYTERLGARPPQDRSANAEPARAGSGDREPTSTRSLVASTRERLPASGGR